MKKFFIYIIAVPFMIIFQFACSEEDLPADQYLKEPLCDQPFIGKDYNFQVVGFYPYYKKDVLTVSEIAWDRITRIIYAFAVPQPDGTLNTTYLTGLSQLIDEAHNHGVEVYFAVGGGGTGSRHFPAIAADREASNRLVKEIRHYLFMNCLDGVDIDWEYWSGSSTSTVNSTESEALIEILEALKNEIFPFGLGISIDLPASDWGGKHFMDEVADHVDHLQVMAYDFSGPWSLPGPHSSFEDAIGSGSDRTSTGLAYWVNYRKWPGSNTLLGVPFYGRDFDVQQGAGISYAEILERYPDAWAYDQVANIYHNGLPTMTAKAGYVKENGFSGIMIWELAQDHPADSLSLLNAIHRELNQ